MAEIPSGCTGRVSIIEFVWGSDPKTGEGGESHSAEVYSISWEELQRLKASKGMTQTEWDAYAYERIIRVDGLQRDAWGTLDAFVVQEAAKAYVDFSVVGAMRPTKQESRPALPVS